ncbi:DUF3108 domain-containing protein [Brucella gallinifaecis]|uniref:DUF3108 domain-containing protein n=1 Tax=Brucella gallinifaecis TaxID=215590 RepID=A0A502BLB5_9HYPH|nr:DUF3108 domain-containing protein [Brucella gallinifaecis]TPF74854.1 DUF3108 domain-containing protein [Brucella gallinifaecis]
MIRQLYFWKPFAVRGIALLSGLTIASVSVVSSTHADDLYRTEYDISIFGLSIARSAIETIVKGANYGVNGRFKTSGIARVFDDTDGTVYVAGRANQNKVTPSAFDLAYKHGRKNKSTKIGFSGGNVTSSENVPPVKKREPWVEITPQDLINVSDPLSALMIPTRDPKAVCNRILRVFDGQTRADIHLSFNGTESFTTKGFTGESVICSAKFVPLAGYQKGKKAIDYLANRSKITISFASLGNSGIYAPLVARIGTQLGTLKIEASRFEKIQ